MSFKQAVNNMNTSFSDNVSTTNNGALSLASTLNPLVDLFFIIGSVRGKPLHDYRDVFMKAFNQNPRLTLQMILWVRDIRGGAGERETFRKIMQHLETHNPELVIDMIPHIAEFGRWDDLLIFTTPEVKASAYTAITDAILAKNSLAAKWMPREQKMKRSPDGSVNMQSTANKNRAHNNQIAKELASHMHLTPRQYRKLMSSLTSVVETNLCNKDYENIDYNKLPSVASSKYINAFMRNDEERYRSYLDGLTTGETKVNAGALYPYDILHTSHTNRSLANAQWDALPNFLGDKCIIPMIDTSGSMGVPCGGNGKVTCMEAAMSLGMYIASKQTGAFKNLFLNFSSESQIFELKGNTFCDMYRDLNRYRSGQYWDCTTNIDSAFDAILDVAVKQNVPQSDMPEFIVIMSDMEFDESQDGYNYSSITAYESATRKFAKAGYKLPKIVFWNMKARTGNNPVRFDTDGTALISGLSPSIMQSVLSGEDIDPVTMMLRTIDVPRYRIFG